MADTETKVLENEKIASVHYDARCERIPGDPTMALVSVNGIEVDRVPTLYYFLKKKAAYSENNTCQSYCFCLPCVFHIYKSNHLMIMDLFRRLQEWKGPPTKESDIIWFRSALLRLLLVIPNPPSGLEERWKSASIATIFYDLQEISLHWHFIPWTSALVSTTSKTCRLWIQRNSAKQGIFRMIELFLSFYIESKSDIWTETKEAMQRHAYQKLGIDKFPEKTSS